MTSRSGRGMGRRPGTAAVEMAFVISLLLLTIIPGIWEIGKLADAQQVVSNAAREGARQASTNLKTEAQIKAAVWNYLKDNGFADYSGQESTVTFTNLTNPGLGPKDAKYMDTMEITVQDINYSDVTISPLSIFTNSSTKLSAKAVWVSMKDQVFPDVADPEIPTP